MTATILPIGATITYTRTAVLTGEQETVSAVVEGRNWSFENFASYIVNWGEVVYPHQIVPA